ncbi:MAG: nucleoside recognition domain-containing protein [Bacteroidota bacterium]|jgi:spore maturation protein SpmA
MALSRFWTFMIVSSVVYVFYLLLSGGVYNLGQVVNGKQNDVVVVAETEFEKLNDTALQAALQLNQTAVQNDTTYRLMPSGTVEIGYGRQAADGIFPTCKNTMMDLWLPLIGYLTFFCGLLHLLSDSRATEKLSRLLTPVFARIFPELPKGHPAYGFMTMNFAANFLGLDNAATPFGLKAMDSMQEVNADKNRASNSQIMFLCLHAAGLTLIPTSIIGYRAAQGAVNPSDIMIPTIITSFVGTLAALVFVSIKQRINLINGVILGVFTGIGALIGWVMYYIQSLQGLHKIHFTGNLSNAVLLVIILAIVLYSLLREKVFKENGTNPFESFVHGAKEGFTTGVRVLPYMIAMLVALSIFRNSGLMNIIMSGISSLMNVFGIDKQVIDAIPVALMRPFSAGGSRGFMLDAMKTYGADSLAGRLSCLFQGAAETTFYVIALYFGSVNVKDTRYTLGIMLLVDLVCVLTAVVVTLLYF